MRFVLNTPPRSRVDERCRANRTRAPRAWSPRVHTGAAMKPGAFIAKWRVSELKESSAAQEHFIDLCRMLASRHRRRPTRPARPTALSAVRARIPAVTAAPTCRSGAASPGSTRAGVPTSTRPSTSCGSTRWRCHSWFTTRGPITIGSSSTYWTRLIIDVPRRCVAQWSTL